jgi:ubiquinone/menaquinone biosynthesis C-methylase UbiE
LSGIKPDAERSANKGLERRGGEIMPEQHRVCPWWAGYLLASPIRKLMQHPQRILEPYVRAGMTVLEPGPGMGFFTLELARLVGPNGRVVAVDVQPRMIEGLKRRAGRAGLLDRIDARLAPSETMALGAYEGAIDFVLAFAVVHELPSAATFFAEAARAMKPGASLLLAEPAGHVKDEDFRTELELAARTGLSVADRPEIRRSQAALLRKS